MGSLCAPSTNTATTSSSPPPQVLQNYQNIVNQAQGVSNTLSSAPGPPVAGITPEQSAGISTVNAAAGPQTQAYYNMGTQAMGTGLGTVASGLSYLPSEISGIEGAQSGIAGAQSIIAGAQSMLPTAEGYVSSAAPYYGAGASAVGESEVNPITSGGISAYMNPYTQDVVNSTEAAFNNQNAIQANQLTGSAILGGNAFGGDRAGVAQAALAGQQQTAEAPVIAGLESSGYTSAVQEAEQQQQLEQSGASIYGSLGAGLGSLGSITGGLASTAGGLASTAGGLASTAGGLAGMYGTAASTAGSLGATQAGIGSQEVAAGSSLASTLLGTGTAEETAGATQQATQQAQLNSEYQQYLNSIGVTGTSFLAPIVEGTGSLSGGTSTTTSAGPSTLSQLSGVALGGLGLLGATGAFGANGYLTGNSGAGGGAGGGGTSTGGRINYDDGGSVDDDQLDFGTSGSPAPQQQQPGLGGIVGYDALARELSQGIAANQLGAAQGGFDGGGGVVAPAGAQPLPGLASLPTGASSNSGIIGPMGMNVPRGSGPPGIHMGMGPPQPPRAAASDNDLANITKQITQVAGLMRQPGNSRTQAMGGQDAGGQATGGRVFPGIVAQGYADGGAPDQDYTAVDPGIGGVSGAAADVPNAPDVTVNGTPQAIVPADALPQNAPPDAGTASPGLAALQNATYDQESGYGRNTGTSSAGAVGPMQIEPATFAKYAQPGERIDNPTDNKAVGDRILADYTDKYGDPARAAVAYYSGPGNVAPADSPTPWKHDISHDRNGNPIKPVSSYVSDVMGRMGGAPPSGSQPSSGAAPGTPGITAANPSSLDIGKPNPWESVLASGLGMMAGQSPHALSNIGAGGLAGLQNYQEQQAELRAEATTKQGAQRLTNEASYQQQQMNVQTAELTLRQQQSKADIVLKQKTLEQGRIPPGYTMQKGQLIPLPGGPADPVAVRQLKEAGVLPKAQVLKNSDNSEQVVWLDPIKQQVLGANGEPYVPETGEGTKAIATAIETGIQPPTTAGLYRNASAVRAQLAKDGFDLTSANLEYEAAHKQVLSLNGPQMVRYSGLAHSVLNTIDETNSLAGQMQNTGVPLFNQARLQAYIQTAGNSANGQLAAKYLASVNTLKEEFANLAQGGYAPTEAAWGLANQQINGNYGVKELGASLNEVQRLLRYRLQGIPNMGTLGPGAANRYTGQSGNQPTVGEQTAPSGGQPTASQFTGRTATNPKTNQTLRETADGKWVP
jgi:hypothetical protein